MIMKAAAGGGEKGGPLQVREGDFVVPFPSKQFLLHKWGDFCGIRLQAILLGCRMFCDATWIEVHLGFPTRAFGLGWNEDLYPICVPHLDFMSLGVCLLILEGTSHECQVLVKTRKGNCKSWDQNYRWLIASLWLRSKPRTSGRTFSVLTCWEVFQPPPQPYPALFITTALSVPLGLAITSFPLTVGISRVEEHMQ